MINGLQPIPVKEISKLTSPKIWLIEGYLKNFATFTPISGIIKADSKGNLLQLKGKANTAVNLSCDKCLTSFNYKLEFETDEMIWIGKEDLNLEDLKLEVSSSQLASIVDFIDPNENFDPAHWLFEQLNLRMPLLNICGDHCPGSPQINSPEKISHGQNDSGEQQQIDSRWIALKNFH